MPKNAHADTLASEGGLTIGDMADAVGTMKAVNGEMKMVGRPDGNVQIYMLSTSQKVSMRAQGHTSVALLGCLRN